MDKHALPAVIVLLLLVAAQAHELRGSSSSSSSGSVIGVSTGHAPVEAGDPPVNPRARTMSSDGSSSAHEDDQVVKATRTALPPRATVPPFPSFTSESNDASLSAASPVDVVFDAILDAATCFQSSDSADESSASHTAGFSIVSPASPRSDSERATITTTAPVVYVFSSSSLAASSSPSSDSSSSTAAIPVDVFQSVSSYSAGTVEPNEERTEVASTALELSTSSEQVQDAVTTTTSTTPSSDTSTMSTDGKEEDDADDDADTPNVATSDSTLSSPIFYGCVVLGVAGLVGTGFVFRAKRQHSSKAQWTIATEAFVETPPMRPPISQVRVVIDDHNFAIL